MKYAVDVVYPDGNPVEVARSSSALLALEVAESYPHGRRSTVYAWDTDDPESGFLHELHPAILAEQHAQVPVRIRRLADELYAIGEQDTALELHNVARRAERR